MAKQKFCGRCPPITFTRSSKAQGFGKKWRCQLCRSTEVLRSDGPHQPAIESRKWEAGVGKPTIDQILNSLTNEVLMGRAYLTIADGLKDWDPIVLKCSPTFFGLSVEASLQMSQMYVEIG